MRLFISQYEFSDRVELSGALAQQLKKGDHKAKALMRESNPDLDTALKLPLTYWRVVELGNDDTSRYRLVALLA